MKENYTIRDISATLSVSERTVQRWIENLINKDGTKILIPEDVFELLKSRHSNDISATTPDNPVQEFERVEYFTEDEYQEFHRRLVEYQSLKEQVEYHRKSAESHNKQMEIILNMMQQRNFIEAKEKNLDKRIR
jgi:DNA-binding transcriptional regulator LsrR (DeoR family)